MEFVLCCLGVPFCFGGGAPTCKMTPICKPTSTSKPALPTNHPFCRMGGALLQAASHNISSSHPFFRIGGDALLNGAKLSCYRGNTKHK
jgi:hypothetical protein